MHSTTLTKTISLVSPAAPHITLEAPSTLEESYRFGSSPLTPKSRQQALQTYLLGYPIAHSLSPPMQNGLFASSSLSWKYNLLESPTCDVLFPKLRSPDCIGAAVTMPFKLSFMSQVDDLTDEGRVIGAINTIFIRNDPHTGQKRYIGTNTDCIGVREAFEQNIPNLQARYANRPALVIGGGGACRSAVYALHQWLGASKIYLVNRLRSEVDDVIALFSSSSTFAPQLIHVDSVAMAEELEAPTLVVGTVPDYPPQEPCEFLVKEIVKTFMQKKDDTTSSSSSPTTIDKKGAVLEMCYHPMRTTFFELAESAGWDVIPGTEAMIYQGIAQQVLWTETPLEQFDAECARECITRSLAQKQPQH